MPINETLFNQPYQEFTRHLSIPDNERIIFSSNFGMGKTTFLRWYFSKKEISDHYNAIHLFPVNYSVAGNEDIFRYIKYDIITELLNNNYPVEEKDINLTTTFKAFFKTHYEKIAAAIIYMIPLLGKQVMDTYDKLRPLIDAYEEIENKLKDEMNEGDKLIRYIEQLEKLEGSIFEDDIISKTIEGILNRAKQTENNTQKENVLIVDDLDRIDPEHVFRLLNIFAAHFDRANPVVSKNKFGFDKVIFVCDIQNIREIFRAKFGLKVDFNGYIDKFFSSTVYNFDHSLQYSEIIYNYILSTKCIDVNNLKNPFSFPSNDNNPFLKYFIKLCVDNYLFDLRNIVKWVNQPLYYQNRFTIQGTYSLSHEQYRPIFA